MATISNPTTITPVAPSSSIASATASTEQVTSLPSQYPCDFPTLQEALENIGKEFRDLLSKDKSERQIVTVRRRHFWQDTMAKIAKLGKELLKPLYIEFAGEDGDDFGGLTREFFSLCFSEAESHILQGPPKLLSPIRNHTRLTKGEFVNFGKLIALALLHGCSGPHNLAPSIAREILEIDRKFEITELPDFGLQEQLKEIQASTSSEKSIEAMKAVDDRYDAGIPYVQQVDRDQFIELIMQHRMIDINAKEISDIKTGLQHGGVLSLLQKFKDDGFKLLTCIDLVTVNEFKSILKVTYSSDVHLKELEVDVMYNFSTLLEDIEMSGKVSLSYMDPFQMQMVVKDINLQDILQHITGSRYVNSSIRENKIKVSFTHGNLHGAGFLSNTCDISLKFPCTERFVDSEQFREAFLDSMANSPWFTVL